MKYFTTGSLVARTDELMCFLLRLRRPVLLRPVLLRPVLLRPVLLRPVLLRLVLRPVLCLLFVPVVNFFSWTLARLVWLVVCLNFKVLAVAADDAVPKAVAVRAKLERAVALAVSCAPAQKTTPEKTYLRKLRVEQDRFVSRKLWSLVSSLHKRSSDDGDVVDCEFVGGHRFTALFLRLQLRLQPCGALKLLDRSIPLMLPLPGEKEPKSLLQDFCCRGAPCVSI